jgi:adenylosuccinate synthase
MLYFCHVTTVRKDTYIYIIFDLFEKDITKYIMSVRKCLSGLNSRSTAILGAQWGDEGKGKLVDCLSEKYDVVARFNGGDNAGHTVVKNGIKHALHLVPCGILSEKTKNILGNGCVINIIKFF